MNRFHKTIRLVPGPPDRVPTILRLRLLGVGPGYFSFSPTLGGAMTITGIISAILIGIVLGVIGRLLVPGKQPIGMLVTIGVGIVSAFIGTAIARALGIPTATSGVNWLELLVQVIVAAIGVALVSALMGRRRGGLTGRRRSGLMR
jgi:uncharacterized membrane protein YeaQ/YmgE (transglycosylase-associated protein family)